jgi:4-hydroxybenzoate polyprenyltransferase
VRGTFDPPVFILWFALTVWIAGFDLIYACQDVAVDRAEKLHSFPARFGIAPALRMAQVCHVLTVAAFAGLGVMMGLGIAYWVGVALVAGLFGYEHSLVSPGDLSRLDVAFFNVNGYIAVILLAAVLGGRL